MLTLVHVYDSERINHLMVNLVHAHAMYTKLSFLLPAQLAKYLGTMVSTMYMFMS